VTVHRLSRADARRIAVRAQLLDRNRPAELLDTVRGLTFLQTDATNTVAPSADLVAWSRLGAKYRPSDLTDALEQHTVVEYRGLIRPSEDVALYRADMAAWRAGAVGPGWRRTQAEWVQANDAFRQYLLRRLEDDGPLAARDLPDTCAVPWTSSGWNNNRNVAMMLEFLELRGEVACTGLRRGRERLWDLASRVFPDGPTVPADEALRRRNERRLRSLGLARSDGPECPVEPNDVAEVGEPAVIDGVRGGWRVDPAQLGQPFTGRAAILSPLDRLVYDRRRMTEIFEFDYQLEMYKPAAKRRWGYFALPILYGDRLVGKLDATADRKAGVLRVHAVHEDFEWPKRMAAAIDREITDLGNWLELDLLY
jgi:uncharacterized protein YcaQ